MWKLGLECGVLRKWPWNKETKAGFGFVLRIVPEEKKIFKCFFKGAPLTPSFTQLRNAGLGNLPRPVQIVRGAFVTQPAPFRTVFWPIG